MRNSIQRRKNWIIKKKLARNYPGLYKVVSDYGWGDGGTYGDHLPIIEALKLYAKTVDRVEEKDFDLSKYVHKSKYIYKGKNAWTIDHRIMDSSSIYSIRDNGVIMSWEKPDFDPGDI